MDLWEYGGTITLDGREANMWQRQNKAGNKVRVPPKWFIASLMVHSQLNVQPRHVLS
jgi:hypothetical protein